MLKLIMNRLFVITCAPLAAVLSCITCLCYASYFSAISLSFKVFKSRLKYIWAVEVYLSTQFWSNRWKDKRVSPNELVKNDHWNFY